MWNFQLFQTENLLGQSLLALDIARILDLGLNGIQHLVVGPFLCSTWNTVEQTAQGHERANQQIGGILRHLDGRFADSGQVRIDGVRLQCRFFELLRQRADLFLLFLEGLPPEIVDQADPAADRRQAFVGIVLPKQDAVLGA